MRIRNRAASNLGRLGVFSAAILVLASCGGGGGSSNNNPPPPVSNTVPVEVKAGPGAFPFPNALYTSLTICVPGSTTSCQTIDDIQVDTGSYGLRLLSSAVTLNLPAVTDNSSNPLQECVQFADLTYVWGPVATADIEMAGEKGSSVPVQLIAASPTTNPPQDCTNGAPANGDLNTIDSLGANGIIGVGVFRQDCGSGCTTGSFFTGYPYWFCPGGSCSQATVPVNFQLQNPVWTFSSADNNGLLVSLPAVPDTGSATLSGSMIFGIGTQSDNPLGSAVVYSADDSGNFRTTYNGVQYGTGGLANLSTNLSFIDSGSNGLFILDPATLNAGLGSNSIIDCADSSGFYCPASVVSLSATNTGAANSLGTNPINSGTVAFKIGNADTLTATGDAALGGLAGDNSGSFDWGLPFFYGRTVFVGIEGQTGPSGVVGPYWAY